MDRVVVVCFILNLFSFTTVYADYQVDALIALKNSLSGPSWVFKSWNRGDVNPCGWSHITCDDNNGVTRVDLGNYRLSGGLVADLGNLDKLQYLMMFNNNISGSIPWDVERLCQLVALDLYNNKLTGPIPWGLGHCKTLKYVELQGNNLCGPINTHQLGKVSGRGNVNINNNPGLCGGYTYPPCSKNIKCP